MQRIDVLKNFYTEHYINQFKNGKPIYVDGISSYLEAGESETESIDIPEDWEASENSDEDVLIDFDSIGFVVNRASAE